MDNKSLEKNLANMERELLNLQTAHDIGLGATLFWEYSGKQQMIQTPYAYMLAVLFEVKEGERMNPIINFYTSTDDSLQSVALLYVSKSKDNRMLLATSVYGFDIKPIAWKMVSSSQLNWHYAQNWNEVIEWLGEEPE